MRSPPERQPERWLERVEKTGTAPGDDAAERAEQADEALLMGCG
jgi:hypothetical protein